MVTVITPHFTRTAKGRESTKVHISKFTCPGAQEKIFVLKVEADLK